MVFVIVVIQILDDLLYRLRPGEGVVSIAGPSEYLLNFPCST